MPRSTPKRVSKKVKQLKRTPLDCDALWGWQTEDVASAVDWNTLQKAFDALVAPSLWANKLKYQKLVQALPLQASGAKTPLFDLLGRTGVNKPEEMSESPHFVVSSAIALQESPGKGRGWFATKTIEAGTLILVERPLVAILDVEWRDEPWADCSSADTAALGMELAKSFSRSVDLLLEQFHPKEATSISSADSEDEDIEALTAMEDAVASSWKQIDLSESAKRRLQDVVRLNSLGFYTNSEQLCHHGNFLPLTGSGVFAAASGFNHSCEPSVQRFSIGDLTAFVTNQKLEAGTELHITYIESEMLRAPKSLRSQSLNRDFTCSCPPCGLDDPPELKTGRRTFMRVDAPVQAKLSLLSPEERVETIAAALQGQMDDEEDAEEEPPEVDDEDDAGEAMKSAERRTVLLGKDAQELRVAQAMALMQLGRWEEALQTWRQLAAFACHHCPPYDEALAVFATQAALCALEMKADASQYVKSAIESHRMAFGFDCFRWRYQREVEESNVSAGVKDSFFSVAAECPLELKPFSKAVAAWNFRPDEVPAAYQIFPS